MRRTRLVWAAAMWAAAVMVLAGYTEAGALRPAEAPPRQAETAVLPDLPALPAAAEAPAAPEPEPWTPPEGSLRVVVRDGSGQCGPLQVLDEQGAVLCEAEANELGAYVLTLPPGRYTLAAADGQSASFRLLENAAVDEAAGSGWSDGEILHLDGTPRCMLRLLRTAPEPVVYTLTGPGCEESRVLGGEAEAAMFAGLLPGTYLLRGSDGSLRELALDTQQPEWVIGLD